MCYFIIRHIKLHRYGIIMSKEYIHLNININACAGHVIITHKIKPITNFTIKSINEFLNELKFSECVGVGE